MNRKLFGIVGMGIIAVMLLAACGGGAGDAIIIKGEDIRFVPAEVTARAGTITLIFQNNGSIEHTLIIDELNVKSEQVQPGASGTITFSAAAGTYTYYCDVPGHKEAGMTGTLTVTP